MRIQRLFCTLLLSMIAQPANAQGTQGLVRITDSVYQYIEDHHRSLVIFGKDEMAVVDPLFIEESKKFAAALKRIKPKSRFKYLIYSHSHSDHIEGASGLVVEFTPPPIIISTKTTKEMTLKDREPTVLVPSETFRGETVLNVGGTEIKLIELPPNESRGMLMVSIPSEQTLFAVDFIKGKTVGYKDLHDYDFPGLAKSIEMVLKMDFRTILFAHGEPGDKAQVKEQLLYWSDVCQWVAQAVRDGKSLSEAQKVIDHRKYKSWYGFAPWYDDNLKGMYRWLTSGAVLKATACSVFKSEK